MPIFRRRLESEILIEAPPSRVWSVLMDFAAYPQWNPFITAIEGKAAPAEKLRVTIAVPGRAPRTFRPRITALVPETRLEWRGHIGWGGLFDGDHGFELERRGSGTLLWQGEDCSGLSVPFMGNGFFRAVEHGFKAMNRSLKQRAERPAALRAAG